MSRRETTIGRDQFMEGLRRTANYSTVEFDPNPSVRFDAVDGGNVIMKVNDIEKPLSKEGLRKVCRNVRIPMSYFETCPKDMIVPHLNYWYQGAAGQHMTAVMSDNEIVAVNPGQTKLVNIPEIVDRIEDTLGGDRTTFKYDQFTSSPELTSFSIVTPRAEEPKVGDIVNFGIEFYGSHVGEFPWELGGYMYRLACSNGMTRPQPIFRVNSRKFSSDVGVGIRTGIDQAMTEFRSMVDRLRHYATVRVDQDMNNTLASLFESYGVPIKMREEIQAQVLGSPDRTLYDVWLAITAVASHSEHLQDNVPARRRLMQIGQDFVVNRHLCDSCHSVVRN